MKKFYQLVIIIILAGVINTSKSFAQNVGIGTTTPNSSAMLHIDLGTSTTKGFLVTGIVNPSSTIPSLGVGSRLMFYPGKAAFRAGSAEGSEWDDINVGRFSVALGVHTTASGFISTAMGYGTTASGNYSTAMGISTTASGYFSTTMGYSVNTNNNAGAFAIGDSDPNIEGTTYSGYPDEFVARFWNGYYLMTSGNSNRFGVHIGHYGNAWLTICDKNRKENFETLNGEDVLQKLSKINFTSWNYKEQDPKIYRHYGIMAQDFYNAFGHDEYGIIGNDTTVNPIDMIGIDMTAIQALEKRTEELKNENEKLKMKNEELENKFDEQQKLIQQIIEQTKKKNK